MAQLKIEINMNSLIRKGKYLQIKKNRKGKRVRRSYLKHFFKSRLTRTKISRRIRKC